MKYPCLWKIAIVLASHACLGSLQAAPVKAQSTVSYSVKSGDTFAKIARSRGISLGELLKANRISNPDHIIKGQKIVIPVAKTAKPAVTKTPPKTVAKASPKPATKTNAAKTTAAKTTAGKGSSAKTVAAVKKPVPVVKPVKRETTTVNVEPPASKGSYIVQSGDTLSRVQRLTGTPVSDLLKLNKLTSASTLRPGQMLRLSTPSPGRAVASAYPGPVSKGTGRDAHDDSADDHGKPSAATRGERARQEPVVEPAARSIPAGTITHKVERGETFTSIQKTYGLTSAQLAKANPDLNPARLQAGQTVMIPAQPGGVESRPLQVRADGRIMARHQDPLATGGESAEGGGEISPERTRTGYLVEDGEDIQKIARRFHTTDREIRRLNRMGESDDVYPGRYILVPFIRQAPADSAASSRREA